MGSNRRWEVPSRHSGFERDEDAAVGADLDAVLGERGAEEIAAEPLEGDALVGRHPDGGVEVEAVELGLAGAARGGVAEIRRLAETADAGAGARAEGDATLDGGPDQAGQQGRGLAEGVGRRRVGGGLNLAAGEQLCHAGPDGGEHLRHVCIARWGCGMEGEAAWRRLGDEAIQHEGVVVEGELEAAPEALDHRHRLALTVLVPYTPQDNTYTTTGEGGHEGETHGDDRRGTDP
jgi:hypothetical protein